MEMLNGNSTMFIGLMVLLMWFSMVRLLFHVIPNPVCTASAADCVD